MHEYTLINPVSTKCVISKLNYGLYWTFYNFYRAKIAHIF